MRSINLKNVLPLQQPVRAVFILSFVMILATLILSATLLFDLRQRELAHAKGETISLSGILSDQTTRAFDGVTLTMRGARERLSDNIGRHLELDSLPMHLLLQARVAGLPQVKSMFVIDRHGLAVNSSRTDFIPRLFVGQRDYFSYFAQGGTDEIFISQPEPSRIDGQWAFYVSMRLVDGNDHFRGVLVTAISLDYFEALYESIGLDSVSRIQLLNLQGRLMAGKPHEEASFAHTVGNLAALAKLQAKPPGEVVLEPEQHTEGRRLVAYRQIAKYPLVIATAVDEEEALTPWRHVAVPIVIGVLLILLLVITTTTVIAKNLLRRSRLEAALKESDEQLRHMVQSVKDAIMTVSASKRIVLFNSAAEQMFGVPAKHAIGRDMGELLADSLPQPQRLGLLRYLEEGLRPPAGQAVLGVIELCRDGQTFPVELSLSTTRFRDEILLTAVFRDLTERQQAERELLETNRQLQELSASLQQVRENERTRIARELHDELGQLLTGVRMEVSWLGSRLLTEQELLVGKVASIKKQIDQTIASVRRISSELRPLVLDDLGFSAAANWYTSQFADRTGIAITLNLPEHDPTQGGALATALFRILQESLTNIARHAAASHVEVDLRAQAQHWQLIIKDDGVGFDTGAGFSGGFGLVGMRERAQILGGHFAVSSAPGTGTTIEAIIPAEGEHEKVTHE